MARPQPPEHLLDISAQPRFEPSPELEEWARSQFIGPGAPLENEEHFHLNSASIGFLWTDVGNARRGRRIVGTCELGKPAGAMGRWQKSRMEHQLYGWFGFIPDFVITIDARYAAACDDASFMALIEHELLHAGQELNEFGSPKFTKDGAPKFALRGHDVEEFVSVVRRYGVEASNIGDLIDAAKAGPEIAPAQIARSCGNCSG